MNSLRYLAVAVALLATHQASGQIAPPAPSDPAKSPEQPVQLSPFEVSEESGSGYATTSSVTVSRVATRNTEVPLSAITINQKMIDDLVAVSAEDTLNLISGVDLGNAGNGAQEENTFSIRGYTSNTASRDGADDSLFTASGGFDYSLADSIEVVKGPNGILYGTQNPGGVVNIISKRPLPRARTRISLMGGSFDAYRADLDTSSFFDKSHHFGYRLSAANSNTRGPVDFAGDSRKGFSSINPSVLYRGNGGLEVWLWSAFVRDGSKRVNYITRAFATSPAASATVAGRTGAPLLSDRAFLDGGGGVNVIQNYNEVSTDSYEAGATRSLTFGPIKADFRLIARYRNQFSAGDRVRNIGNDIFLDPSGNRIGTGADNRFVQLSDVNARGIGSVYRDGDIRYDYRPQTTKGPNYDFTLNLDYGTGFVHGKTLVTASYSDIDTTNNNSFYDITDINVLRSLGVEIGSDGKPRLWLYPLKKTLTGLGITREVVMAKATTRTVNRDITVGTKRTDWGIMQRLTGWADRVIVVGGGRYTDTDSSTTNNTPTPTLQTDRTFTPGVAGLVKLYKGEQGEAIAYANFNQTFIPVTTIDQRLATAGQKFPNRIVSTHEYGIKLDMLHSRVVFTGSIFDNKENNVLVTLIDSDGKATGVVDRSYSAPVGARTTKGYELDLNLKATQELEFILSHSEVDPRLANGQIAEAVPLTTTAALGHYQLQSGWAKGLSLTYVYNRYGESQMGNRTNWRIPGGNLHTAVLGYQWKNSAVRLRVENLYDTRDPKPGSFDTGVAVSRPRNFRLSLEHTF